MKFKISLNYEIEIEAENEEKAEEMFWSNEVYDIQLDPATFITNALKIEEIK